MAPKPKNSMIGTVRVGIGGWTYKPWRGTFYPEDLIQKRELEFASRRLRSIEINGTFYGLQKPASYIKWRDETPAGFVFSLKAPRFTTNRSVLAEAGSSIEKFFDSGVLELKDKLGPINWQFPPTKKFEAADFEAFLKLLPKKISGREIRHAVEVRHESFCSADFIALARKYSVAIVLAGDSAYPQIADITAPFVYARIMGTKSTAAKGYSDSALDVWATRAQSLASGVVPPGLQTFAPRKPDDEPRAVYLYVISGFKERNPAAAMALAERVSPIPR